MRSPIIWSSFWLKKVYKQEVSVEQYAPLSDMLSATIEILDNINVTRNENLWVILIFRVDD